MNQAMHAKSSLRRRTDMGRVVRRHPNVLQYITTSGNVAGDSGTPAVGSGAVNLSSITDGGVGIYTINLIRSYATANWAVFTIVTSGVGGTDAGPVGVTAIAAGSVTIRAANAGDTAFDCDHGIIGLGR